MAVKTTKAGLAAGTSTNALMTQAGGDWDDHFQDTTDNFAVSEDGDEYVPDGFKDVESFLTYAREEFAADAAYDRTNREAAMDDLKFTAGDQWDPVVKADRESKGRPCITINVLPQFIGQVIGDRRINKTSIKVRPRKDATVEQADARSGLIRSIEAYSRAERVYDASCEAQVTCGISNFRIDLDYAADDVFEQDIFVRLIPNPLAVIWDRMSIDSTGRDANHCFVTDSIPRKVYERRYGTKYPAPDEMGDGLISSSMLSQGWFSKDTVRICEFWRIIEKQRNIALYQDGSVVDITDIEKEVYEPLLWKDPRTGKTRVRRAPRTYAQMHLMTGSALLEPPYELPITRLPIIRVEGRVIQVGEDRVRFGLVRWAKDAQRLKNYWRSTSAETLALAPKAVWLSPDDAVEGREDDFRQGHVSGDNLLVYNKGSSAKPERVDPPQINGAALQESQLNQQDIKDTTGLQDASLGVRTNEISGRAIQARQREGDVATVIYHDNLNAAIQEGGDVMNQLIPIAYDTVRQLRIIGPDDKHLLAKFNDPNDQDSIDITSGKYDISIDTGPSYTTQRMEAADSMMQAIQVAPELMGIAGDLIVKAQDWPGAYEISERLKKTIPPNLLPDDDPAKQAAAQDAANAPPNPAQLAAQAQIHEAAAASNHQEAIRKIELQERTAQAQEAGAKAQTAAAHAEAAPAHVAITVANAKEANAKALLAEHQAKYAPREADHRMHLAERAAAAKEAPGVSGAGSRPSGGRGTSATPRKGNTK